jgi:hypothetical protein
VGKWVYHATNRRCLRINLLIPTSVQVWNSIHRHGDFVSAKNSERNAATIAVISEIVAIVGWMPAMVVLDRTAVAQDSSSS